MSTNTVNFKTQEQNADNSAAVAALDYLTAWNLVAIGNLDEAEHLLFKNGMLPTSIDALDLLARIAIQKGQIEQAKQLWKTVLEKDPTHKAAKAAIKRLGSPWIAIALIKRVAFLAVCAVIFCLSIAGLFTLFNLVPQSQLQPATSLNRSTQIGDFSSVFSVPGCSVYTNQGEMRIVFDDGLFSHSCKLKHSSIEQLSTFARLLQENAPSSRIIIEGHTDLYKMRKNSLYKDNYTLGLQRALTVAEILKLHQHIAGERILVTSMGDKNPPFPAVNYKSKLKNRTVVIRLF